MQRNPASFEAFLSKYIALYKIFVGTNDYEVNIAQVAEATKNLQTETLVTVSGGWYSNLVHMQPKKVIFYDVNPAMLIDYAFIWELISISSNRQQFLKNIFCREAKKKLQTNQDVIEFLDQPYDKQIFEQVKDALFARKTGRGYYAYRYYRSFIFEHVIQCPKEQNILFPSYFYSGDQDRFVLNKKLRSTQKDKTIQTFFTTFYYDHKIPFDCDENYERLHKTVCAIAEPQFILFNVNNFMDEFDMLDKLVPDNGDFLLYIDGIDDEVCYYLKRPREYFFAEVQQTLKQRNKSSCVTILSTKSGITRITADAVETSKESSMVVHKPEVHNTKDHKRANIYNKPFNYDSYTWDLMEKLNKLVLEEEVTVDASRKRKNQHDVSEEKSDSKRRRGEVQQK